MCFQCVPGRAVTNKDQYRRNPGQPSGARLCRDLFDLAIHLAGRRDPQCSLLYLVLLASLLLNSNCIQKGELTPLD